ncbi:POTRA domain-containing protein [Lacinutrix chionoecetis]
MAQNLNLNIEGTNDIETQTINDFGYKRSHEDFNSIVNEADSLQLRISKAGYIENERVSIDKENDSVFRIILQLKNKYERIKVYYDSSQIDKKIIDAISDESFNDYFNINFLQIEKALQYINLQITNQGYPFAKTKFSEIKIIDNITLSANLIINKGETKRGLDNIIIKGYEKFPKAYLKRFLKIKPEKTFNIETIKKKMNALNNLRFAEQIKPPEVLFTKDSTTLYIYLKKSQSNTFDGFLGFSTNEETNSLDFNGYLNLELNNNLNYGESIRVLYKTDESEQKNFEFNANLPYLFNSPIGTELGLKILKQDSSFTTVNQKANLFYQLNSKSRIYTGIESTESNNLLDNNQNFFVSDYSTTLYTGRYVLENRNNYSKLFQLKTLLDIEIGLGSRTISNNKEPQQRLTINTSHILNLNNKNSIYLRLNSVLLNSDSYLENELFRFGGINSIRGFEENSLLASSYILLNTEYRYQLTSSIYAHSILDFANFENKITTTKESLYGFGIGFGIITKAGLLKFNFANGKTETQSFKFSNSKIHLSLTSVF